MRSGKQSKALVAAAASAAVLAGSSFASAAALVWNGSNAAATPTAAWSVDTNWTPTAVPASGDTLQFGSVVAGATRLANNDLPGLVLAGVNINGNAYNISGNSFSVAGTLAFTAGTSNVSTISAPVALTATTLIDVAATTSGRLQIDGDITGAFDMNKNGAGLLRFAGTAKTYGGDTNINFGTLDISAGNMPNGAGKGNVNLAGGAFFTIQNLNTSINGLNGAGTLTKLGSNSRSLSLGFNNANGAFSGPVSFGGGSSGVTKEGTGTQVFSGTGSLAGGFFVNAGRMIVDGTFTAASSSTSVNGTIGGTGSLGVLTVNGQLKPGGTLTSGVASESTAVLATGNLTLAGTSTTTMDLVGLARESQYDGVDVAAASTLTYGGTLNVNFASVLVGTFDLFNAATTAGNFAAVNLTGAVTAALTNNAGTWSATAGDNTYVFTQSTGDLVVSPNVVPEPASLSLLAGAAIVGLRRRR